MVIDFHTHAFPDFLAQRAIEVLEENAKGYKAYTDGTLSGLLAAMDRAGVDAAVVCSIATAPKQVRSILEWSCQIAGQRVFPFPSVHPACDDPYQATADVARAGLKGLKLHPQYQGFFVDDPDVFPIYRAAADHGLIVLLHAGYDLAFPTDPRAEPRRIAVVLREFPGLRLVAAHMGGWKDWEQVLEHLAGRDVFFDTSFAVGDSPDDAPPNLLRAIIEKHGTHRILFGTDSPWREHCAELAALDQLGLPDDVKAAVLGGNGSKLLGLD